MRAARRAIQVGRAGLLVFIAFASGCGGAPDPVQQVCARVADVTCFDLYQCCSPETVESVLTSSSLPTEAECHRDIEQMCRERLAGTETSIASGRVKLDTARLASCLGPLYAPLDACFVLGAIPPWTDRCLDSVWIGQVADGSRCSATIECHNFGHSFCNASGICAALPGEGDTCDVNGCAAGLYCDLASHICRVQAPPRPAGAPCESDDTCQSGECSAGTCAGTSASCHANADCGSQCMTGPNAGLTCAMDVDCGLGYCTGLGGACSSSATCDPPDCEFSDHCVPIQCTGAAGCTTPSTDYCAGALRQLEPLFAP